MLYRLIFLFIEAMTTSFLLSYSYVAITVIHLLCAWFAVNEASARLRGDALLSCIVRLNDPDADVNITWYRGDQPISGIGDGDKYRQWHLSPSNGSNQFILYIRDASKLNYALFRFRAT
jgi:hypothetical protein